MPNKPASMMQQQKISVLTPTHRYAAAALFSLSLRQAHIHQTRLLGSSSFHGEDDCDDHEDKSSLPWTHPTCGLLRSVFRFLEIDSRAWPGLEETACLSTINHHVGAFLRLLSEDSSETSSGSMELELALSRSVDAMALSLEVTPISSEATRKKQEEYEHDCCERISRIKAPTISEVADAQSEGVLLPDSKMSANKEEALDEPGCSCDEKSMVQISYQRKVAVLFELISACLADMPEDDKEQSRPRKGYDARHRVALRLLATWLDVKWIKMEAMEILVAFSAMNAAKEEKSQKEETESAKSKWSKWKRGGIIGAAALTGGTLLALTGGLAAPAIAAGFSALAPTLGTLIPVIGASGFAAAASAAGSVAGSVAVAASFGAAGAGLSGTKMARRIGEIDEFEFIPVGKNHNQGRLAVGILVSGFVFEEEDFLRPWEGCKDNLERYALQWESKYLIAVSTAIQDWITSSLTLGLMKQGAMVTVLSTLVTALAWPAALLSATNFIDSKWTIAVDRSDKAGKLLAEVLLKGLQGSRPVTLVGFSLGSRVIFKCLLHLAETGDNAGLVERVVLLGAPIPFKDEHWEIARKVVAGRFVNVYCTNDWTLGVAYRASLLTQGLAGIQPIDVPGIENVDVTELLEGHSSYLWTTQQILEKLELDTYYPVFSSFPAKPQ
ncbi:hypothetical protein MRB53_018920 [Persea americana]|uniref:Uncharacterized protein n=1 Tax=Persea americana TaxID=3435 RepID=A0ACC2M9C9_PERAE|nr:hypothetical protein MRB53_018920 [Persea americana]